MAFLRDKLKWYKFEDKWSVMYSTVPPFLQVLLVIMILMWSFVHGCSQSTGCPRQKRANHTRLYWLLFGRRISGCFSHGPWTQQGTFISKPSPFSPSTPKSYSSAFMLRHCNQTALQIEPVISSDMTVNMVGEMGGEGVGSGGHHGRTM